MTYDFQLQMSDCRPLAVVRRHALPHQFATIIPQACGTVWNVLHALNVQGAGRHIALYFPDHLDVGVELQQPFPGHGEVLPSSIPPGNLVTTTHLGPYSQLRDAHRAIHDWCARHGHTLAGPNWEIYGHWLDEWNRDPSKIRTDIFYLLRS